MQSSGAISLTLALAFVFAVADAKVPIVGQPCEGCEAVFDGMPTELSWDSRIAPESEPGEPVVLEGIVRDAKGEPVEGIVVYAYHTDAEGIYPRGVGANAATVRHGRLRGWTRTGADGRYRFRTIRPAGYPGTRIPQHVHMHVIEPDRCTYYIDDVKFGDDPRLSDAQRRREPGRGGPGIVTPSLDETGTWHAERDIVLGAAIPGYEECETPAGR